MKKKKNGMPLICRKHMRCFACLYAGQLDGGAKETMVAGWRRETRVSMIAAEEGKSSNSKADILARSMDGGGTGKWDLALFFFLVAGYINIKKGLCMFAFASSAVVRLFDAGDGALMWQQGLRKGVLG